MASETEIANMALSHIGIGKEIGNLDSEKSQEASACRRFYTKARDSTLRDFPWPFACVLASLALVSDPPTETEEWAFSYRYPVDSLKIRRIQSGLRNDAPDQRVKFRVGRDGQGGLIYTDESIAKVEYTFREDDTNRFPEDFSLALSFLLAHLIAPRLTGGDPFKLGVRAQRNYIQALTQAQASAANEEVPDQPPESEFIRAREGDTFLPPGRGGGTPFGL